MVKWYCSANYFKIKTQANHLFVRVFKYKYIVFPQATVINMPFLLLFIFLVQVSVKSCWQPDKYSTLYFEWGSVTTSFKVVMNICMLLMWHNFLCGGVRISFPSHCRENRPADKIHTFLVTFPEPLMLHKTFSQTYYMFLHI